MAHVTQAEEEHTHAMYISMKKKIANKEVLISIENA
jgi:hypothetical protein